MQRGKKERAKARRVARKDEKPVPVARARAKGIEAAREASGVACMGSIAPADL